MLVAHWLDQHLFICLFLCLRISLFLFKAAEKEIVRTQAEEEAQEKRKIVNAERKAAKKAEQKKAKLEMKKRKVNCFLVKY